MKHPTWRSGILFPFSGPAYPRSGALNEVGLYFYSNVAQGGGTGATFTCKIVYDIIS
jgi:hypothetical protein